MTNLEVIFYMINEIRDPRLKQEAFEAITQVAFEELGGMKKDREYMSIPGCSISFKLFDKCEERIATNPLASTFNWADTIFGPKFWYRVYKSAPVMILTSLKHETKL